MYHQSVTIISMPEAMQMKLKEAIEIARNFDLQTLRHLISVLDQKKAFAEYCSQEMVPRAEDTIESVMRNYDGQIKILLGIL